LTVSTISNGKQSQLEPELKPKAGFARNLVYQKECLYGMVYMECCFCNGNHNQKFKTPITFDMELHIYEQHRGQLFYSTAIDSCSLPLDTRIAHIITKLKVDGRLNKQIFGPECFVEMPSA
jgi:hypothetical protein